MEQKKLINSFIIVMICLVLVIGMGSVLRNILGESFGVVGGLISSAVVILFILLIAFMEDIKRIDTKFLAMALVLTVGVALLLVVYAGQMGPSSYWINDTYVNPRYGFSIEPPKNWTIKENLLSAAAVFDYGTNHTLIISKPDKGFSHKRILKKLKRRGFLNLKNQIMIFH